MDTLFRLCRQHTRLRLLLHIYLFPTLLESRFSDKISSSVSSSPILPFYSKHLPLQTAGGSTRPKLTLITPASLDKMPSPPALGALGLTFQTMRSMQFASLITIIGLTANFVSEMVAADYEAPPAIIGTLVIVS